jgi:signal peptidase II
MNRLEWLLVILPFISTWTLDRSTKMWGQKLVGNIDWGLVQFQLHYNPGAMLGLFSDLPPFLRVVSLSTAGAFILAIYFFLQYLIAFKSLVLRGGMSMLVGGIIGNVTDRIMYGQVVDFIYFKWGKWASPIFNVADALQWFGYFMIAYSILTEGQLFWPENNSRKRYWINLKFQLKYCVSLLLVGFLTSTIISIFSYTYLRVTLIEVIGNNKHVLGRFLDPFFETFILIVLGISIGLFVVGKIISHRIAGPIYALERYLNQLMNTPEAMPTFKLRAHDEFKHLEVVINQLREKMGKAQPTGETPTDSADVSHQMPCNQEHNPHPEESTQLPKAS